jgi:hypothetical protein
MISEADIVTTCSGYFTRRGYVVTPEVPIARKVADLYCVNLRTGHCVALEAKLRDWAAALSQALVYQLGADLVYIAMPHPAARKIPFRVLADHGIGLLAIHPDGSLTQMLAARPSPVSRRTLVQKAMVAVGTKAGEASLWA